MYGITTTKVLDDTKLSSSAKVLFSIILGLLKVDGKVHASDFYFATKMNASISSIQRWLKNLKEEQYITTEKIDYCTREICVTQKAFWGIGVQNGIHN